MAEEKDMTKKSLWDKIIGGAIDAVKVPLKKRAMRLKFISAYNDLLKQKAEAESEEMKELEKLDEINMTKFLEVSDTIDECDKAIDRLERGFRKLFDEDMPKDV